MPSSSARPAAVLLIAAAVWLVGVFVGAFVFPQDPPPKAQAKPAQEIKYRCNHGFHAWTFGGDLEVFPAGGACP